MNAKVACSTTEPKARFRPQECLQTLYTLLGIARTSRLALQHGYPRRVEEVAGKVGGKVRTNSIRLVSTHPSCRRLDMIDKSEESVQLFLYISFCFCFVQREQALRVNGRKRGTL